MNITNRQLYFFILVFTVPFVICLLPQILSKPFGTGAWIYILIMAVVYSISAGLIAYLGYMHQNQTLFEYCQPIVGKFLTYCFTLLYFIEFIAYTVTLSRATTEIIHADVMVNTPRWFLLAVLIAASVYVVSKGMTNVGRMAEFFGIIIMIVAVIVSFLMASQGDVLNIEPFFNLKDPQKYISMIPASFYLFSGFEFMTIIPFTKRNGIKVVGTAMLSVISIGLFYVMDTEACYMILGVEDASNYTYPLVTAMRRVDIDMLQFLKRVDLLFITAWLTFAFISISISLLVAVEYARKLIHKPNNNVVLIVLAFVSFILGMLIQSDTMVNKLAMNISLYLSGITIFLIPVTILITAKVKKHEKNMPNQP